MKIVERIAAIFCATVLTATAASAQVVGKCSGLIILCTLPLILIAESRRSKSSLAFRATLGGKHPGRGTRNAFIALGPNSFLEIVAPDPDQPPPKGPRAFFKGLTESKLVRWFINSRDIRHDRDEAVSKGVPYGEVKPGSRQRLPHPSQSAAKGARLISLRAEHPDPREAKRLLLVLGLKLPVKKAKRPALIATIEGPRGRVELK